MGLVIGAAGLGNTLGIALGSLARRIDPKITLIAALLADVIAAAVAAIFYGLLPAIALGLTAGIAQALGKLALDSTIQLQVPEQQRTSAFGRSETVLQLSWVIGGFIGIALPLIPQLGLGILAGLIAAWTSFVLIKRPVDRSPALNHSEVG
ncbi:MAG TPA: MFS transporter, partial [Marmoricola sp.]|nr:MFS transporter [Marmoricola sp.]